MQLKRNIFEEDGKYGFLPLNIFVKDFSAFHFFTQNWMKRKKPIACMYVQYLYMFVQLRISIIYRINTVLTNHFQRRINWKNRTGSRQIIQIFGQNGYF
jgi:hypothetical protein